jgi:hypothetical protein
MLESRGMSASDGVKEPGWLTPGGGRGVDAGAVFDSQGGRLVEHAEEDGHDERLSTGPLQ